MFFDYLDKALYVHHFNTVPMRRDHENDVVFLKDVMAASYAIKVKTLYFKNFPNVFECNVIRPSLELVEQLFASCHPDRLSKTVVRSHDPLQHGVALLPDIGYPRAGVVTDERWRECKGVDLKGNTFDTELVFDNPRDQLLFKLAYVHKLYTDAGVLKPVEGPAVKGKVIFVRQLDFHPKLVADVYVLFPPRKAAANGDLLKARFLTLAELCVNNGRDIQRKSNVLSLIYRHRSRIGPRTNLFYSLNPPGATKNANAGALKGWPGIRLNNVAAAADTCSDRG